MSRPSTQLALERGGVGERRIADRGTQIGEQLEVLAQAQQAGLGALVVRHAVPFRPADRAEHHRVGGLRALAWSRPRSPRRARRRRSRRRGRSRSRMAAAARAFTQATTLLDLGHHFGADAVAGEQEEFVGHALRASCVQRVAFA